MNTSPVWIGLVDAHRGRLVQAHATPGGHCAVDDVCEIEFEVPVSASVNEVPQSLRAKDARSYASLGHVKEETHERAAREAMRWLRAQIAEREVDSIVIYASSSVFGTLRDEMSCATVIVEPAELTNLEPWELAKHPEVTRLVPACC